MGRENVREGNCLGGGNMSVGEVFSTYRHSVVGGRETDLGAHIVGR